MTTFLIFGILGIVGAIIAQATRRTIETRALVLSGEASLALFPLFGLIAFLFPPVAVMTSRFPWYTRGAAYMAAFFVVQYAAGLLLRKVNFCPWSYEGRYTLSGLIRLSDAPVWFAGGLAVERVYPWVKAAAVALR